MSKELPHILMVEDEPSIAELLRFTMQGAGFATTIATDVAQARKLIAESLPHVVLLDWMLPDSSGLVLLSELRRDQRTAALPVIMLTAKGMEEDKVKGLNEGADDYVTKPFDSEELLARLRVALRRSEAKGGGVVRAGEVSIDPAAHRVERAGAEVHLTRKEYEVLTLLADHAGRVVTHKLILQRVWGGHDPKVEYLRIVIRNLRQKLEAPRPVGSLIANEQGIGYRLIG